MAVREDPPPGKAWTNRLAKPAMDPGNWYLVLVCDNNKRAADHVHKLRTRQYKIPSPDARWKFRAVTGDNGEGKVYAGIDVPDI